MKAKDLFKDWLPALFEFCVLSSIISIVMIIFVLLVLFTIWVILSLI